MKPPPSARQREGDGGKSGVRVRVRERCAVRVRKVERLYIARDDIII